MDSKTNDIIKKSCEMFSKFGIKSISMDEIAKACGISKKTLYEHVSDKRALVIEVLKQEFDANSPAPHSVDISDANAVDALFIVYQSAVAFFKEFNLSMEYDLQKYYPDLYVEVKSKRRKHLYEKLSSNMDQGRNEGFYRDDFNIDIITKLHILKIESMLNSDIFDADDYSIVDIFKELFIYHFYAIANDKGRRAIELKLKEIEGR